MAAVRPASEEEAANLALRCLREPGIATMADQSKAGRAVRAWFAVARDETLRENAWNFATGWAVPAAAPEAALGPLKTRFPLPQDCLFVRSVLDASDDSWATESALAMLGGAEVETLVLVTNLTTPVVCFTRRVETVRLWDPQFLIAFAMRLAHYMAPEFGKGAGDIQMLGQAADKKTGAAASRDASEGAPSEISRSTSWTRAQRVGWSARSQGER